MILSEALDNYELILLNGPVKTRLEFEYGVTKSALDIILEDAGQPLEDIFAHDIRVIQEAGIPVIMSTLTFRSSKNNVPDNMSVEDANKIAFDFAQHLKQTYQSADSPLIIDAPIGSMYNAYSVETIPSIMEARQYHQQQIDIFQNYDIDFISGITLPSLNEAMAIALVAEQGNKEYTISFVLDKLGLLLDGTPLNEAIKAIDDAVKIQPPVGYMVYCTHTSVFDYLTPNPRVIGLKANASALGLDKLDNATQAHADGPDDFVNELIRIKEKFNLKILGGCCGTSNEHLTTLIANFRLC